ncbi:MAG: thiamine pyrophosphate-dependent enzyme [Rhodocyclaceae bacterium]
MHLFDPAVKFSCSGIVGAGAPQACGAALAAKKLGKDWVAVAFFGEGAASRAPSTGAQPGLAVEAPGDLRLQTTSTASR